MQREGSGSGREAAWSSGEDRQPEFEGQEYWEAAGSRQMAQYAPRNVSGDDFEIAGADEIL